MKIYCPAICLYPDPHSSHEEDSKESRLYHFSYNNNNSCESHLCYTNIEWMYLSTQCLYLISFCTLPTPVIFRVEQEKSSLPSIFHFPFKNCNNSLHFHLICTSYIPFCFTTVSPFIAKSIISKLIFRRPNLSFSSTSMINNFEID